MIEYFDFLASMDPCRMKATRGTKEGADQAYKITFCVPDQYYWVCVYTLLLIFVFANLQQKFSDKYLIFFVYRTLLIGKNTSILVYRIKNFAYVKLRLMEKNPQNPPDPICPCPGLPTNITKTRIPYLWNEVLCLK